MPVDPLWYIVPAVVAANRVVSHVTRDNNSNLVANGKEKVEPFVCERVCSSKRLLNKLGGLAKDASAGTCVTVCGESRLDSCTEACQRTLCFGDHQVPAWNEECMKKCTQECLKGRSAQAK
mmetsp:Transcript_11569/g.42317  ORF Transcript_11569/g.42317 Transcript_11569/m.42317 type:complete len:121 (+) Transcript_11569:307-669(+)